MREGVAGNREKRFSSLRLLAAFCLVSVLPVMPEEWRAEIAAGLLILVCWVGLTQHIMDAGFVTYCLLAAALPLVPFLHWWPAFILVPLVVYGFLVWATPVIRPAFLASLRGRVDGVTIGLMVLTVVGSSLALVLWHQLFRPDLSDLGGMIPSWPVWLLPLAGLGFAMLNALTEEVVWRGILWELLDRAVSRAWLVVPLQAVSFGLAHIHGFPRGWFGVGMATLYGLFLGWIRHRSGGLSAPVITHVFADLTIFAILALAMLQSNGQG